MAHSSEFFAAEAVAAHFKQLRRQAEYHAPERPADCVMPNGTSAIIMYTNQYHFPLHLKQHTALQLTGAMPCVGSTLSTIAVDRASEKICTAFGMVCVGGITRDLRRSNFKRGDFHAAGFLKWRIVKVALEVFQYVFMFDADVMLMGNPWPAVLPELEDYDLRTQVEHGWQWKTCDAPRNSGQLLVRRSNRTLALIDAILAREALPESPYSDQDNINPAAAETGARVCQLPTGRFVGLCNAHDVDAPLSQIVTFHTNCKDQRLAKSVAMDGSLRAVLAARFNASCDVSIRDAACVAGYEERLLRRPGDTGPAIQLAGGMTDEGGGCAAAADAGTMPVLLLCANSSPPDGGRPHPPLCGKQQHY